MKRRTNPRPSRQSRLSQFLGEFPPFDVIDSMTHADAWLAIVDLRSVAYDLFTLDAEIEAFTEYVSEFLRDRGLVERVDSSGSIELLLHGSPIAGVSRCS